LSLFRRSVVIFCVAVAVFVSFKSFVALVDWVRFSVSVEKLLFFLVANFDVVL